MANIAGFLELIQSAIYGRDVRSSIVAAIDAINRGVEADTDSAKAAANTATQKAADATSAASSIVGPNGAESRINAAETRINSAVNAATDAAADAADNAERVDELRDDLNTWLDTFHGETAGVLSFGPPGNLRTGPVYPGNDDYTSDMIKDGVTGNTVKQDLTSITQAQGSIIAKQTEFDGFFEDIHNVANVDIDTPVVKCYGVLGGIGATGLQSMCTRKEGNTDYIYTYGGTDGRFYKVNTDTHAKTLIQMYNDTEHGDHRIDKGNGMCCYGNTFYLIGLSSTGDELKGLVTVDGTSVTTMKSKGSTINLGSRVNGIDFKEVVGTGSNAVVHLWGYGQNSQNSTLTFWDINTLTGEMTTEFVLSFPEAKYFDQDMAFIDGYFYIVSDYHGCLLKVSLEEQAVKKVIRLAEFADNGIYTGEYEGIAVLDGKLLLASSFTDYLEDEQSEVVDMSIPTGTLETISLKRPRHIIFTTVELDTNIKPYSREMRGSLASQCIIRHINSSNTTINEWMPDGTWDSNNNTGHPYPTPGMAFSAYKNPRHKYIFVVDGPYTDSSGKPFMIVFNQKNIRIHLTSACANIILFFINSNVVLSSDCNFKIGYLMDSTVDYISEPSRCISVRNYRESDSNKNFGNSRFNCVKSTDKEKTFGSPFGNEGYTPNGDYMINRTWGSSSATTLTDLSTITSIPKGKMISFRYVNEAGTQFMGNILTPTSGTSRVLCCDGNMNLSLASFRVGLSSDANDNSLRFEWFKTLIKNQDNTQTVSGQVTKVKMFSYQANMG